jgi:hypothetical protein
VVLVVLVLVWAVVLGPSLLRRTVDRQSKDSIGSFHRQLHVLERTGPSLVAPAHRLATSAPSGDDGDDRRPPPVSLSSRPAGGPARFEFPDAAGRMGQRRPDPYYRPSACQRRRDVLMVLVCTLTITGLIGIIPALHLLLGVTAIVGLVLVAYLGLLVRLRNRALEREAKLRYLPRSSESVFPVLVRRVASR